MAKAAVRRMAPLLDLCLVPFAALFSPLAMVFARMGAHAGRSRRWFDRVGVSLVRHHYYQPIVEPKHLHRALEEERELPGLDLNPAGQLAFLAELDYAEELKAFPQLKPADGGFFYRNATYESGDAELLYGIIRRHRPRRLVEIGGGYSTLMAQAAIRRNRADDPGCVCEHVCIEPYEAPWLESLGLTVVRQRVELMGPELFRSLEAGDILFIDSSHVIRPQGDVLHEHLYVLPQLAPGVLVHFHDVFTPRDYLRDWVVDERKLWNEQYLLEAFLSCNREFEIVAALNWLSHNHREALRRAAPVLYEQPWREPGAFWIRKVGSPAPRPALLN
jgi:hypothetical protein